MSLLMMMDVAPEPTAGDLALLPVMIILAAILVLSVAFVAGLAFFLIRYKRRKLASAIQPEPTPGVEQFAQTK
ncbi:MAG TPA: hypothetical protein VJU84_12980 [Pyrinomonadaceae bacterium]|nr:hypothetical protein [Pyrinomonadaceae bacterium]